MGQLGFALSELVFEPSGQMYARSAQGETLKRRAEWNAWAPLPTYAPSSLPLPPGPTPRTWDVNGSVYFGEKVIYRLKKGSREWERVPGSLGKTLQTVDPQGNIFALSETGSEVLPAGSQTWVPSPAVSRIDALGRAYAGNRRLDGASVVVDDSITSNNQLVDANGDILEFTSDATSFRITRRPFGATEKTEVVAFSSSVTQLELLGCGLEGTCIFYKAPDVFQASPGQSLRQVGSTQFTSANDTLNFSGFKLFVGPEGRLYLSDVSGNASIAFSRVVRLKPFVGRWPGAVEP